jgi:accessory gene regulator protein AgrB
MNENILYFTILIAFIILFFKIKNDKYILIGILLHSIILIGIKYPTSNTMNYYYENQINSIEYIESDFFINYA